MDDLNEDRVLAVIDALTGTTIPEDALTQGGYPTVAFLAAILPEGFDPSAAERNAAWDRMQAAEPEPEDPDAFFVRINAEDAETAVEEPEPAHGDASSAIQLSEPEPAPQPRPVEDIEDTYAARLLAAAAAWNAVRTLQQAEKNDRYCMDEWQYASRPQQEAALISLSGPPDELCDAVLNRIDRRLLPIARFILTQE